jgi:hypothetical protein
MQHDEEPLTGGDINEVTRRGDVVYRTGGPWVPAVHSVLEHLLARGCPFVPRPLGMDARGREMISYLPGVPMTRPWRPVMFGHEGLTQAVSLLRSLHDATSDLVFPPDTMWRTGAAGKRPGEVIRHGDLGPWNTLWHGNRLTGLIDWDFAEPGDALTDLAQMALYFVPLRGELHWQECGFPDRPDFAGRLDVLVRAYGAFTPGEVAGEVARLQLHEVERTRAFAAEGRYPWTMFRDNGEIERTLAEVAWLRDILPS